MVSDNFLRLPIEKQNIIKEAAIKEFSKCTLEQAKVVNICKYADIPRRTFYNYFDSLEDIYRYVFYGLESNCSNNKIVDFDCIDMDKYFMNVISSDIGLKEIYKLIKNQDESFQNLCHIAISISFERKLELISKEEYREKIYKLFK